MSSGYTKAKRLVKMYRLRSTRMSPIVDKTRTIRTVGRGVDDSMVSHGYSDFGNRYQRSTSTVNETQNTTYKRDLELEKIFMKFVRYIVYKIKLSIPTLPKQLSSKTLVDSRVEYIKQQKPFSWFSTFTVDRSHLSKKNQIQIPVMQLANEMRTIYPNFEYMYIACDKAKHFGYLSTFIDNIIYNSQMNDKFLNDAINQYNINNNIH